MPGPRVASHTSHTSHNTTVSHALCHGPTPFNCHQLGPTATCPILWPKVQIFMNLKHLREGATVCKALIRSRKCSLLMSHAPVLQLLSRATAIQAVNGSVGRSVCRRPVGWALLACH